MYGYSGLSPATVPVSRSTACGIRCALLSMLTILCSGCQGSGHSTYHTERLRSATTSPSWMEAHFPGSGAIPERQLLLDLKRREVLTDHPPPRYADSTIFLSEGSRVKDVIDGIESREKWVYDERARDFYEASATHPIDGPDSFGRRTAETAVPTSSRRIVSVGFRFRRITGGGTASSSDAWGGVAVSASGAQTVFFASVPDGVEASWSSTNERSYYEGVRDPAGSGLDRQVETARRVVEAGLQFAATTARLPGYRARISGQLSISAFAGRALDRSVIACPVEMDLPRGTWVRIMAISGADAGADVALRHFGFVLSGTADYVQVEVRVD